MSAAVSDGWPVLKEGRFSLGANMGLEIASVRQGVYRRRRVIVVGSWVNRTPSGSWIRSSYRRLNGQPPKVFTMSDNIRSGSPNPNRHRHDRDLDLADRISRLLVRLELGIPPGAVMLARHAGVRLSRGD
jgi:hypothetical protein